MRILSKDVDKDFTFDMENLEKMYDDLSPKNREKAFRGGIRGASYYVYDVAMRNLRTSGFNVNPTLAAGMKRRMFSNKKRGTGFEVTIRPHPTRNPGALYKTHQGRMQPLLLWAEIGAANLGRDDRRHRRFSFGRLRRTSTGKMPRYAFMERTYAQVDEKVIRMIRIETINYVKKLARKYSDA